MHPKKNHCILKRTIFMMKILTCHIRECEDIHILQTTVQFKQQVQLRGGAPVDTFVTRGRHCSGISV